MILFVDPDEEGLLVVVEDTSSIRPVSVETTCLQESVTLLEQEVVVYQLLAVLIAHGSERVVLSSEFTLETVACLNNFLFNLIPLFFCTATTEWEFTEIAANTDPSAFDHLCVFWSKWWAFQV